MTSLYPAYDPATGEFSRGGKRRGSKNTRGYITITVADRPVPAHRLAWFLSYGEWPKGEIDHIDGSRANNALANLRLSSRQENARNSKLRRDSKSGFKGVAFEPRTGRWRARITYDGRLRHIGCFATAEEAHAAYMARARGVFGEFARAG